MAVLAAVKAGAKAVGSAAKAAGKAAGNAAKKGVQKGAQGLKKKVEEGIEKMLQERMKKAIKLKIYLYGGAFVVVIGLISTLITAATGKSNDAVKSSSSTVKEKVLSGEMAGNKEQIEFASELQEKYGSNIGYTLGQIEEMTKLGIDALDKGSSKDAFKSSYGIFAKEGAKIGVSNSEKLKIKEAYDILKDFGNLDDMDSLSPTSEAVVWYYNYSNEGKMKDAVITPYDKVSLFEHMLKTEKYNFNQINWMKYSHDNNGEEITKDKLTYDSSLGLLYPSQGNAKLKDFMEVTAPYILTSEVPRTFVSSSAYSSNVSDTLGTSVVTSYWDANDGVLNHHGDFGYEIIKHGISDITYNQYELQHVNLNTYYEIFDAYNVKDTVKLTEKWVVVNDYDPNTGEVRGLKWAPEGTWDRVDYVDGTTDEANYGTPEHWETNTESKHGGEHKAMLETAKDNYKVTWLTYEYKLSQAMAFDVLMRMSYDYTKYENEAVEKRLDEGCAKSDVATPFKRVKKEDESKHIDINTIAKGSPVGVYTSNGFTVTTDPEKPSSTEGYALGNTKTITYVLKSADYTYEQGDKHDVVRKYADTVSAEALNSTKTMLGISDVANFNSNKKNDVSMSTVNSQDFRKDTTSVTYHTDLSQKKDTALNTIDLLNSNPKIALNYMSSGQFNSTYLGYTRTSYAFAQGMKNLKSSFKKIAAANNEQLPWVYGASLGFDVGATRPSTGFGGGVSGFTLLREYIRSFEGSGPMSEDKSQYIVYADSGGVLTVGYGVTIKNFGDQIMDGGRNLKAGDRVDVELVDAVEDAIIRKFYEGVKSSIGSRTLTEYQLHALTCFAYNLGSIRSFNEYYDRYWDQERDDQYEEQDNNPNLNHGLYTEFFSLYTHDANGTQLAGLVKRRKSEFTVFSTGYYDTLDKWYTPLSTGNMEGIDVYNADGSVNEDKIMELQEAIEARLGMVQAPKNLVGSSVRVGYSDRCAVTGQFYGSTGSDRNQKTLQIYQCTWWANSRASEYLYNLDPQKWPNGYPTARGNGGEYYRINQENGWFAYGPEPRPNSIGSGPSSSSCGHVYYVEAVDYAAGYYYISHAGGGEQWFGLQKVKIGEGPFGHPTHGFIYLDEPLK